MTNSFLEPSLSEVGDLTSSPDGKRRHSVSLYADGGDMVKAFDKGAVGCGELSRILASVMDELWKCGYANEDLKKIYGGNKMRVYREVWEGIAAENDPIDPKKRGDYIDGLSQKFQSR